jgi:hypothetical protein
MLLEFTAYNSASLSYNNIGLGNVLYQLSFQYSICKKHNITPNYSFLKKFIEKIKENNTHIFRKFTFKVEHRPDIANIELKETNYLKYDDELINQIINNKDKTIFIKDSYLQSYLYFHEYEEDIQQLFEPDEEFMNKTLETYPQLLNENNIAIQLRLNWGSINLDPNFIVACLDHFGEKQFNMTLWVFSDNMNKAKEIMSSLHNYNIIFVTDTQEYEDLWMMSLIPNHIVSFSTFSWWGAYLNKSKHKTVLYSSDYYHTFYKQILNRHDLPYEVVMNNFYPKEWICINKKYMII